MNTFTKPFKTLALTAALLSATTAIATPSNESTSKLLTANFDARQVIKIEAGDFHFVPGQIAPIHTHAAPAIGYVAKGEILYQVEGEKTQLLREGDAFFEPVGPRILRFDNASATEEAIFIDFNLQQQDEPFIVFEKALTGKIDRRTLPTTDLKGQQVDQVDVFISELEPNGQKQLDKKEVTLAYVAEGVVTLKSKGEKKRRIKAGETFSLASGNTQVQISNASSEVSAKVVAFYLR